MSSALFARVVALLAVALTYAALAPRAAAETVAKPTHPPALGAASKANGDALRAADVFGGDQSDQRDDAGDGDGNDSEGAGQHGEDGDGGADGDGGPAESPLRALACLEGEGGNDADGARRGVQKRDFIKRRRFEVAAIGGYFAADALSSTWGAGGALSFFPSEDFGVELLVTRRRMAFRLEEPFTAFDGERHFQGGTAWDVLAAMAFAPVHAKLRWSERSITHADLMVVAGAGKTVHGSVQGLTFEAGLGLKLYLSRFFSVRFDVRDLIVPQDVLGRGQITHNVALMLGLAGWVPG